MPTVMVVDDEPVIVEMISEELKAAGYQVDCAYDGVEAVLHFISNPPDFVLMDIRMPRLSGVDALEIMKKIKASVPVVTFTGNAGSGEMMRSNQLGAETCLAKPLLPSRVLALVRDYVTV